MSIFTSFVSDMNVIKCSGDNACFIYNPKGIKYEGESFKLFAGETILVVPQQPDGKGPWKQYKSAFIENRFLKNREEKYFCLTLENRWLNKTVTVTDGTRLDSLLAHQGIAHRLSYCTQKEMNKILTYSKKPQDDDDDEYMNTVCKRCKH
jgi:hypothetical protein